MPMARPDTVLMKACVAGAPANALAASAAAGLLLRKPVTRLSTGVPMLLSAVSCRSSAGPGHVADWQDWSDCLASVAGLTF